MVKKKEIKKKDKKKILYDDSWMYTLLLSTIVILGSSLKTYALPIAGVTIPYTIFIIPFMLLLTNYITKKYNFQRSVSAIFLSSVSLVLFTYGINYALGNQVSMLSIGGEMGAYIISQMVNLYIYVFLLNNTRNPLPAFLVWINYFFALILFYMIYTLINLNVLVTDSYWGGYFLTLLIQGFECILVTAIDVRIKRGREE